MRTLWGAVLVWCTLSAASEACVCHWGRTRSLCRPPAECAVEPAAEVARPTPAPQPNVPMITAGLTLGLGSALGLVALFRKSL